MPDSSPDTAALILDAAEEAFADAGFAGARVNAIAAAAGVNKAMLYYYFESKEGLYRAVLERVFGQVAEVFSTTMGKSEHADIRAFLAGYRGVLRSHPHLARLIMRDVIDGAPHVREILAPRLPPVAAEVGSGLARGQAEGRLNPAAHPFLAAPILVSPFVMFALIGPILSREVGIPVEAIAPLFDQTAEAILLDGLLARPEES